MQSINSSLFQLKSLQMLKKKMSVDKRRSSNGKNHFEKRNMTPSAIRQIMIQQINSRIMPLVVPFKTEDSPKRDEFVTESSGQPTLEQQSVRKFKRKRLSKLEQIATSSNNFNQSRMSTKRINLVDDLINEEYPSLEHAHIKHHSLQKKNPPSLPEPIIIDSDEVLIM